MPYTAPLCSWRSVRGLALLGLTSCVMLALFLCVRSELSAQPPVVAREPLKHECRRASGPITLDGKGDEESWKGAEVIDDFILNWQRDNPRKAKTATRARLLWDDEYLYFLADMDDVDLFADEKTRDGTTWDNDVFELFFKPAADKLGYYEFQVNAAGTIFDMYFPSRGSGGTRRFKNADGINVEAKVVLRGTLNDWQDDDQGWTVEGRIAWKDLKYTGGRPSAGDHWKFALCRYDYSKAFESPELSSCARLNWLNFHQYEDYSTLEFKR